MISRMNAALVGIALASAAFLAAAAPQPAETAGEDVLDAVDAAHAAAGEALWSTNCSACHDVPEMRAPALAAIKEMSRAQLRFTLTDGKMKAQAAHLSDDERQTLIEWLTPGQKEGFMLEAAARCETTDIDATNVDTARWGGNQSGTHHYAGSTVTKDNVGALEVAWVVGMPETSDMRSQPIVTGDTVFTAAPSGHLFALDRETGCVKWHRNMETQIRASLTLGSLLGAPVIYMQDGNVTVYALDAYTGDTIWSVDAAPQPGVWGTGAVVQAGDMLIVPVSASAVAAAMDPSHECCRTNGAVVGLDAASGEIKWTTPMTEKATPRGKSSVGTQLWGPSGVPVWVTPSVDEKNGRVYIGTGENTSIPATDTSDSLMALDIATGKILWKYQATEQDLFNMACGARNGPNCPINPAGPDWDFGGGVSFATLPDGREVVVGGQKSGVVHVVDAATGELIWKTRVGAGSALGGIHWGVAVSDGKVFAPVADPRWPRPDYDPTPGLFALDLAKGEKLWEYRQDDNCIGANCPRTSLSSAVAVNDELVFASGLDGMVRAFDKEDGRVLWEYATAKDYGTIHGTPTKGGAIDNGGVVLAGDMVLIPSGYSLFGQLPGNALIALRVKE